VAVAGTATCVASYAGPGSHTITAIYSGDANFNPSTSAPLTQTANIGNTTTAVTSSANPSVAGQNVTYTADGYRDSAGVGDEDGHRQLPGWRRHHRRLRGASGGGRRHGDLRRELCQSGQSHHQRRLQR